MVHPSRVHIRAHARPVSFFGATDVSLANEFYENADEHFRWAESAKTERERAIFLQMAAAWLEAAQRWEANTRS